MIWYVAAMSFLCWSIYCLAWTVQNSLFWPSSECTTYYFSTTDKKVKLSFYIAQFSVRWTAQGALHFWHRSVHSGANSASLVSEAAMKTITHISSTIWSQILIYTAEWTGASWRERKCPIFETVAKGIRTRVLSIASPPFYHWATAYGRCYFSLTIM